MSTESIVQSLDAVEARKQAVERRRSAGLRELVAAMDEREWRKSGLSLEEWAALKRERASARAARAAARQQAEEQKAAAVAAFCESHAPAAVGGLPDATAVALALSEKHVGGKAVRMSQLLQEAHLATAECAVSNKFLPAWGLAYRYTSSMVGTAAKLRSMADSSGGA